MSYCPLIRNDLIVTLQVWDVVLVRLLSGFFLTIESGVDLQGGQGGTWLTLVFCTGLYSLYIFSQKKNLNNFSLLLLCRYNI